MPFPGPETIAWTHFSTVALRPPRVVKTRCVWRQALSVITLVTAMSGCATSSLTTPNAGVQLPFGDLIAGLAERQQTFRSLRSLARIDYRIDDRKGGFQGVLVVDRPRHLRLEVSSLLGADLILTADEREVQAFHPREGRFYRGASSRENLYQYTQVFLELDELTALLLGLPPVEGAREWEVEGYRASRRRADRGTDVITFDLAQGVPSKWSRLDARGNTRFVALFEDFESTPSGLFPMKISFSAPSLQRRVVIDYDQPELNARISPSVFVQEKPETAVEVPLRSFSS